jgi:hypothetical protein
MLAATCFEVVAQEGVTDSCVYWVLCHTICALLQPAKLACIEYPREPSKDEAYAWVCLYKAVWVADAVLGMRAQVGCNTVRTLFHWQRLELPRLLVLVCYARARQIQQFSRSLLVV